MIAKIANILLLIAVVLTFLPKILLSWFPSVEFFSNFPWWIVSISIGGLGLVLYVYILLTSKRTKIQLINSAFLLSTIVVFLLGEALYKINPTWQKYCFVAGIILFITWLILPNKEKEV